MDACDRQTDIDAAIKMNYNTHVKTLSRLPTGAQVRI
jgi:hypothetical protein